MKFQRAHKRLPDDSDLCDIFAVFQRNFLFTFCVFLTAFFVCCVAILGLQADTVYNTQIRLLAITDLRIVSYQMYDFGKGIGLL